MYNYISQLDFYSIGHVKLIPAEHFELHNPALTASSICQLEIPISRKNLLGLHQPIEN